MTWQPIETAPRNTAILACGRYSREAAVYAWSPISKRWLAFHDADGVIENQSDFGTEYKTEFESCITHWMPMPDLPDFETAADAINDVRADLANLVR